MSVGARQNAGFIRRRVRLFEMLVASRACALVALLAYGACEFAIWRPGISFGVTVGVVGSTPSSDYQVATWSLEWWPWAILHGLNPLHTGLLWAPSGYSTTWITSVPVLALLAAPVTLVGGPLVSYNLLMLAAPPCAALACYALCRELSERFWPALLGGFLFGFSPYVLAQAVSQHLNLVMVWPLPLLVLVAVRYCRGKVSGRRAIATSAAMLLFLFGSSLELFATTVILGAMVLGVALAFGHKLRVRLMALALCLGAASAIVLAIATPFVWLTLWTNRPPLPFAPEQYATDLANVLVPTRVTLGGTSSFATAFSKHFVGNLGERDGYLGLPLVAACLIAAWRDWHRRAWIAATAVAIALALSLGPSLVVAGRTVVDLPFALDRLPCSGARLAVTVGGVRTSRRYLPGGALAGPLRPSWSASSHRHRDRTVVHAAGGRFDGCPGGSEGRSQRHPGCRVGNAARSIGFRPDRASVRAADDGLGAPVRRVVPCELLAGRNGHAVSHRGRLHAVCTRGSRDRSTHPGFPTELRPAAERLPDARLSAAHPYSLRPRPGSFAGVAGSRPCGNRPAAAACCRDRRL